MILESILFANGCVLALAGLRLSPRWAQRVAAGALAGLGVAVLAHGGLLAGLALLAIGWGLHAILTDIRRAEAAAFSPSGQAPGGAHAPGEAGSATASDTRRDQAFPHVDATAGCAGRPRALSR